MTRPCTQEAYARNHTIIPYPTQNNSDGLPPYEDIGFYATVPESVSFNQPPPYEVAVLHI